MLQIKLIPSLSSCIETVAKREFLKTMQEILSENEVSDELQEKAEILKLFLQTADFKKLRAESEPLLVRGLKIMYILYLEDGKVLSKLIYPFIIPSKGGIQKEQDDS